MMSIINLYKAFRKRKMLEAANASLQIDSSCHLGDSFLIRQDVPTDEKRLVIGRDCIIGGQFIFESSKGKITRMHNHIGLRQPFKSIMLTMRI